MQFKFNQKITLKPTRNGSSSMSDEKKRTREIELEVLGEAEMKTERLNDYFASVFTKNKHKKAVTREQIK